ncbi:chaplin family protein [Streptomyces sp. NPDC056112]|uniref:chaplin family protein n=1 Tax=unclassified Streptomyces TaxID=2593676 RepID=UPI00248161B6|nr:chaplin family protein [Streptomyces sp. HYC2]
MKRVTRNSVIAVAAASGAMAMAMPVSAFAADTGAAAEGTAAGSPGVLSGNTIQLPVDVPVNVCGNTVDVVGLLNPAAGNRCANASDGRDRTPAAYGAAAEASAQDSPGVVSGNTIQLPVHVPVNVTGNSVNVGGIGNAASGNTSTNTPGHHVAPTPAPPVRSEPQQQPRPVTDPDPEPAAVPQTQVTLAHTGADQTVPVVAAGAALVLGGAVLYRRFRPGAYR